MLGQYVTQISNLKQMMTIRAEANLLLTLTFNLTFFRDPSGIYE